MHLDSRAVHCTCDIAWQNWLLVAVAAYDFQRSRSAVKMTGALVLPGSSGGTGALVAARGVTAGFCSDTGGSCRIPASLTGSSIPQHNSSYQGGFNSHLCRPMSLAANRSHYPRESLRPIPFHWGPILPSTMSTRFQADTTRAATASDVPWMGNCSVMGKEAQCMRV